VKQATPISAFRRVGSVDRADHDTNDLAPTGEHRPRRRLAHPRLVPRTVPPRVRQPILLLRIATQPVPLVTEFDEESITTPGGD
jgi:hypothetical protein